MRLPSLRYAAVSPPPTSPFALSSYQLVRGSAALTAVLFHSLAPCDRASFLLPPFPFSLPLLPPSSPRCLSRCFSPVFPARSVFVCCPPNRSLPVSLQTTFFGGRENGRAQHMMVVSALERERRVDSSLLFVFCSCRSAASDIAMCGVGEEEKAHMHSRRVTKGYCSRCQVRSRRQRGGRRENEDESTV